MYFIIPIRLEMKNLSFTAKSIISELIIISPLWQISILWDTTI